MTGEKKAEANLQNDFAIIKRIKKIFVEVQSKTSTREIAVSMNSGIKKEFQVGVVSHIVKSLFHHNEIDIVN